MTPIRSLALGGMISAALTALGGLTHIPEFIGLAGALMFGANLYALCWSPTK